MKKSLILAMFLASSAFSQSESLIEALKNGKASGDVTMFFESRHVNEGAKSTYYNNTSWMVGSVGLNYESDFYKNFKAVVGFRGAAPVYEGDKEFYTGHGRGDSTERIYEKDRFLLSNLYLQYQAYDTNVKIGRQEMITDWVGKINDGVRITNNSISNLELDALYTRSKGRAYYKEMWAFKKLNEKKGLYRVGATYKFNDNLSARIYGLYAPSLFKAVGTKLNYDEQINESFGAGGMIHYAQSKEERVNLDDGKAFEVLGYISYKDNKLTLAHTRSGKKNGWGSMNLGGDQIVPFEEGDAMYNRDARTYYAMFSTMIEKLSLTALYGTTTYKMQNDNKDYKQNEFSAWLSYPITPDLKAFVVYDQTFKAQPYLPTITQIGVGLSYSF